MTLDARDWQGLARVLEAGAEECRHGGPSPRRADWVTRALEAMRDKCLHVAAELHGAPVTWMAEAEVRDLAWQAASEAISAARSSGAVAIVAVRLTSRAARRLGQAPDPAIRDQADLLIQELASEQGVLLDRRYTGHPSGYLCAVDERRFEPVPPGHPAYRPGLVPIDSEWMARQPVAATGPEATWPGEEP